MARASASSISTRRVSTRSWPRSAAGGAEVWGQALDVADRAGMAAAFDAVAERHGRIDVVFANAGIDAGPGFLSTEGRSHPRRRHRRARRPSLGPGHRGQPDLRLHDRKARRAPYEAHRRRPHHRHLFDRRADQRGDRRHALHARQGRRRPFRPPDGDGTGRLRHPDQLHLARPVHDQHRGRTAEGCRPTAGPSRRSR